MSYQVLLTGAAGFVGTAFRRWFAINHPDWFVDCVDVRQHGTLGRETHYAHDVRRWFARDEHPYDLVIHLAAVVGGRTTIDGSPLSVAVDLAIDAEFFQWVMQAKPTKVVYFSSSAAYPADLQVAGGVDSSFLSRANAVGWAAAMQLRDTENITRLGRVPDTGDVYGMVKAVGEQQAMLVAEALAGVTAVHVFRPFSGYGPGQSLDYPVPAIVDRVVRGEDPVTVWSDTVRDFIHIDDVVAATMAGLDRPAPPPGTWANLCTGMATTFTQIAGIAMMLTDGADGHTRGIDVLTGQPRGPQYRVGDPRKMLEFYTPKINLLDGLDEMVARRTREWENA